MTTVNTTKDIGSTVGSFFKNVNKITPNVPKISLPYKDPLGSGRFGFYPNGILH